MSKELHIFLSHKKGDSERNARRIAGDLALFGGINVKVICSANFDPGEDWQAKIREGLTKAHWLVLLYTGPHTEWDWCLYETGFFGALMEQQPGDRRLICLHDPAQSVPAPLRGFVSLPATEDKVLGLYEDIYLNDPWKLNPDIFKDNMQAVQDAAKRVCLACRLGAGPKFNIHIAPLINLRIKKDEVENLQKGVIPVAAPVTGEGVWETVFGKPEATAGWTWGDLTQGVIGVAAWQYQISSMMLEAITRRSVQYPSIAVRLSIRGADGRDNVYRIGLRRVAEYDDDYEFVFVFNRLQTPFEPSESDRETMLYHLFNMAWYFRRRFIEHHAREMQRLADFPVSTQESSRQQDFELQLSDAVHAVRLDLKALEADYQVRGMDRSPQIRNAFEATQQQAFDQIVNVDWPPLYQQLEQAIRSARPKARDILEILTRMAPINLWFRQHTTALLSQIASDSS